MDIRFTGKLKQTLRSNANCFIPCNGVTIKYPRCQRSTNIYWFKKSKTELVIT